MHDETAFQSHTLWDAGLREMRQKADSEKRDEAAAKASMSSIEARAQAQYRRDLKDSEQATQNLKGSWVSDEGA